MWGRTKFRMKSSTVCTLRLIASSGDQTTKNSMGGASRTHNRDNKGVVVPVLALLSTTPWGSGCTHPRILDLDTMWRCRWDTDKNVTQVRESKNQLGDQGVDRIILKWILMMQNVRICTEFIWLKMGPSSRFSCTRQLIWPLLTACNYLPPQNAIVHKADWGSNTAISLWPLILDLQAIVAWKFSGHTLTTAVKCQRQWGVGGETTKAYGSAVTPQKPEHLPSVFSSLLISFVR